MVVGVLEWGVGGRVTGCVCGVELWWGGWGGGVWGGGILATSLAILFPQSRYPMSYNGGAGWGGQYNFLSIHV